MSVMDAPFTERTIGLLLRKHERNRGVVLMKEVEIDLLGLDLYLLLRIAVHWQAGRFVPQKIASWDHTKLGGQY